MHHGGVTNEGTDPASPTSPPSQIPSKGQAAEPSPKTQNGDATRLENFRRWWNRHENRLETWQSELDRAEDEKAIFKLQVEAELDALKVEHRRARREWTLICLTFAGLLVTGGAVLVTLQGIQTQLEASLKQDQAARYGSISEAMLDVDKTFAQYPALSD